MGDVTLQPTLVILIREGGLIMSVEISEGDTKFLHAMKLEPPKYLRCIVHPAFFAKLLFKLALLT